MVILGYGAKDEKHNEALVLKELNTTSLIINHYQSI